MFKIKQKKMTKTAGTPLPKDTRTWPSEVLKGVVNQHPYIDASKINLSFSNLDPESGASGVVRIDKKAAVPFYIRENKITGKKELDPLDVVYDGEKYQSLDEVSYASVQDSANSIGKLVDKSQAPNKNKYVGDQTGDVTPLEWTPQMPFGPGKMSTASCGITTSMLRNHHDMARLKSLLASHSGINSVLSDIGIGGPLESMMNESSESLSPKENTVYIRPYANASTFTVTHTDGVTKIVNIGDLRRMLADDFPTAVRQVRSNGYYLYSNLPRAKSSDVGGIPWMNVSTPVTLSGRYMTGSGRRFVFSNVIDFDGTNVLGMQLAVDENTRSYARGEKFVGYPVNQMPEDDLLPEASKYDVIVEGSKGVFAYVSNGVAVCTRPFVVESVVELPGLSDNAMVVSSSTGLKIGLVPLSDIIRPQEIRPEMLAPYRGILPVKSYYIPTHMTFLFLGDNETIADLGALKFSRPEVTLHKNAGTFSIVGKLESGRLINMSRVSEEDAVVKMASFGASEKTINKVIHARDGESLKAYGLLDPEADVEVKVASVDLSEFRKLAADALKAVDESIAGGAADAQVADAVVSMQFIDDENLQEVIGSDNIFAECEDKLARMLLASRQGESSIEEVGVQKALKGLGAARRSLKKLAIELDSRSAKQ